MAKQRAGATPEDPIGGYNLSRAVDSISQGDQAMA
jgi:hypothetical protein